MRLNTTALLRGAVATGAVVWHNYSPTTMTGEQVVAQRRRAGMIGAGLLVGSALGLIPKGYARWAEAVGIGFLAAYGDWTASGMKSYVSEPDKKGGLGCLWEGIQVDLGMKSPVYNVTGSVNA